MTNLVDLTIAQFKERFGKRLKHRREKVMHIRQCDLAKMLNVNRITIINYEAGRTNPSSYSLYKLSRVLYVSPGTFLDDAPFNAGQFPHLEVQELMDIIGSNVRRLRKSHNLKQEELAIRCGIKRPYLCHIENGNESCSAFVLYKFSKCLGTNANNLVYPFRVA